MSYFISVRFIMLYLNLWIAVGSCEWPLLQSTICMYFNVARIVFNLYVHWLKNKIKK